MAGTRQRVVQHGAQPGFRDGRRDAPRAQGQRVFAPLGPSQQGGDQPRQKTVARAGGITAPITEARLRTVLHHALASASHCVERAGCTPPRYEEVRERLALRRPTTAAGR